MKNTLKEYQQIIKALNIKYNILTINEYLNTSVNKNNDNNILLLRHDVEKFHKNALEMAKKEYALGIKATYYFRADTKAYNTKVMNEIKSMGHEIGYHYNTLDRSGGNYEIAWNLFKEDLSKFREDEFNISTICMHGQPRIKKIGYEKNGDLFNKYDYRDLNIKGEAYLDIDFNKINYISDTGINWDDYKNNKDLIKSLLNSNNKVYILVHPDYWFNNFILAYISRFVTNSEFLKSIIRRLLKF